MYQHILTPKNHLCSCHWTGGLGAHGGNKGVVGRSAMASAKVRGPSSSVSLLFFSPFDCYLRISCHTFCYISWLKVLIYVLYIYNICDYSTTVHYSYYCTIVKIRSPELQTRSPVPVGDLWRRSPAPRSKCWRWSAPSKSPAPQRSWRRPRRRWCGERWSAWGLMGWDIPKKRQENPKENIGKAWKSLAKWELMDVNWCWLWIITMVGANDLTWSG